jgi:PAS domain S-box-containing protein
VPEEMAKQFGIKSAMLMAIHPKIGSPWQFGLHQCAHARVWTPEEERLFQGIGWRLADALTSFLSYQEMQQSEERYRFIAENTADTIMVFDKNLNPMYVSPSVLKLRDYTVEETMLQSPDQLLAPASLQIANEVLAEQLALEATGTADPDRVILLELETYCKDGTLIWVEVAASILRDNDLQPTGILTVTRNITERKQAEAQLLAREQLFRALVENAPDFVARYDREMRRIYVNPALQRLFPGSEESILSKTPADNSPLDAPQVYIEHLKQVIETATESVLEMPYRTAQGEMRWGQIRFVPEFDTEGQVATVLTIGRDIHEIKENEQGFRMLADNFPDIVVRYDHDGRFTYANPAVSKTFDLPAEAIIGRTLQELITHGAVSSQADELSTLLHRAFDEGALNEIESFWPTETGERIFAIRYVPEKDATGNVISVLSIIREITERKRVEEEIRQLNQELEQRVLARTAELEAANEELEAFAYSVSHDLRAPLRHIDGYMDLLQQQSAGALDDRSQHYMDTIAHAANHMGQLIDDLLSFSRMGRHELSERPVDLADLVQEIIQEYEPEIQGREIRWDIADLPTVRGDRPMLRLVLTNLIANALKFTRNCTSTEIEIGSLPGEKEIAIFIRDNGVGFNMAYADKLFGVFQRLHHADEFEGTGIGLATVRRIINRHGGRAWAEGEVDHGATFYFALPQTQSSKEHE